MTARTDAAARIAAVLADTRLTPREVAARCGISRDAATAGLTAMLNRGEVVRLAPASKGTPYRYRLKVIA